MRWLDESTIKSASNYLPPSTHLSVHQFIHSLVYSAIYSFHGRLLSTHVQALTLCVILVWLFSRFSVKLELPNP